MAKNQSRHLPSWVLNKNTIPYDLVNVSTDYRVNVIASAKFFHKNNNGLVTVNRDDVRKFFKCTEEHFSRIWKKVNHKKLTGKLTGRHYHLDLQKAKGLKPSQFKLLDYLCRNCNIGLKGTMDATFSDLSKALNVSWQTIKDEMILLQKQGFILFSKDKRKGKRGLYNIKICNSPQNIPVERKKDNTLSRNPVVHSEIKESKKAEKEYVEGEERDKCMKVFKDFISRARKLGIIELASSKKQGVYQFTNNLDVMR